MGMTSSCPTSAKPVSTDEVEVTRSRVGWHRKRRRPFFCSAPGRSPASVSTWKPLQMPITGPPARAKRVTASMMGEKRARAPGRR